MQMIFKPGTNEGTHKFSLNNLLKSSMLDIAAKCKQDKIFMGIP